MQKNNPIIIPLDGMTANEALALAGKLKGHVAGFKVNDLLTLCGVEIIRMLRQFGLVMADVKAHDIPNTVGNIVRHCADAGADLITVHASGGVEMMQVAQANAGEATILAVTVLTSFSPEGCFSVYGQFPEDRVKQFAKDAVGAGVGGLVCSPQELKMIKSIQEFQKLTLVIPGIRPTWHNKEDDQSRVATPKQAIADGANYLVIGRPITQADDPVEAAQKTLAEI